MQKLEQFVKRVLVTMDGGSHVGARGDEFSTKQTALIFFGIEMTN